MPRRFRCRLAMEGEKSPGVEGMIWLWGGHSEPIQEVMLKVERAVWLLICPSVMLFGAGPEAVKLLSSLLLPWTVWGGGAGPKGGNNG